MNEEQEISMYYEDDTIDVPEEYLKLPIEELERRADILFKEMKEHPRNEKKKDYSNVKVKFFF